MYVQLLSVLHEYVKKSFHTAESCNRRFYLKVHNPLKYYIQIKKIHSACTSQHHEINFDLFYFSGKKTQHSNPTLFEKFSKNQQILKQRKERSS